MHELQLTILVIPDLDGFVARCQEIRLERRGETPEQARDNLVEEIHRFLGTPEGIEYIKNHESERTHPMEYEIKPNSPSCN